MKASKVDTNLLKEIFDKPFAVNLEPISSQLIEKKARYPMWKFKSQLFRNAYILLLWSVLFFYQSSLAQSYSIDSLEQVLKNEKEDTNKVKTLNQLSNKLGDSDPNKAVTLSTQGILLAKTLGYKKGLSICLNSLGNAYVTLGENQKALDCYNQRLNIVKEMNDSMGLAAVYDNIGIIFFLLGKNDTALELRNRGINIYRALNEEGWIANSQIWIGNIYKDQGYYSLALENYLQALRIYEKVNDSLNSANALINISSIYRYMKQFDLAKENAFAANRIFIKNNFKKGIGVSFYRLALIYCDEKKSDSALIFLLDAKLIFENIPDNYFLNLCNSQIGNTYRVLGDYQIALKYLNESLLIAQKMQDNLLIATITGNIGITYKNLKNYNKALSYLIKSELLIKEIADKENHKDLAIEFVEIYSDLNQPDSVISYFRLYRTISDSLYSEKNNKAISELRIKYESEKKELKIEDDLKLLKLQEQQKWRLKILVGILGLSIIIILLLLFRGKQKNKKLDELNLELNKQYFATENLVKFLNHETARQFGNIKTALTAILDSDNPKRQVNKAMMTVNSHETLYKELFLSSGLVSLSLKKAAEQLFKYNCNAMNIQVKPVFEVNGDDLNVNIEGRRAYLLQYLNELIANSLEHAFSLTPNPLIKLDIKKSGSECEITYSDNGAGVPFDKQTISPNKGFYLLQSYAEVNLMGKLESDFTNGTRFKLTFKEKDE